MSQKRKFASDESLERSKYKKQKTDGDSHLLIFYDLEMCEGSMAGEIYQLGAKTSSSEFSSYILPKGSIDWGVTKHVNGMKVDIDCSGRRQLMNKTKTFKTVDSIEGFRKFLAWIKEEKKAGKHEKVILIAHGDGDMPVLLNNLARDDLIKEFKSCVDYFADSLRYFQQNFKDWDKYKVTLIYQRIFPKREAFTAHDALEDAKALCDIIEELGKDSRDDLVSKVLDQSFDVEKCCAMAKKRIQKTLHKSATKKNAYNNTYCLKFCSL
eukprot:TRINITY_DN35654_c0_g1_i1.p1 TRINITY_DN35654_c0_g1~~TRINITY_DN35654_c0_g1_i1.p1  ORF type:complete len:292 (-),score=62.17 TRINITY_DN35654_c0_g1_i1:37-837(-)